jgi:hypothetical protein
MQTLYAYSGRDVAELRRGLAVVVHDEFTDGELDVAPRPREVRSVIRTGLSGPVTFMHSLNGTDIFLPALLASHPRKDYQASPKDYQIEGPMVA